MAIETSSSQEVIPHSRYGLYTSPPLPDRKQHGMRLESGVRP